MNQLETLRAANIARQAEWCADQVPDLSFRGNELGGECGEAQNVIKKLERERHGWTGSRATLDQLAQELADVVICVDLVAQQVGIDLWEAVVAKFNATSRARGLRTLLGPDEPAAAGTTPQDQQAALRQALADALTWHEAEDEVLSKSGRSDADYQWRRLQHREQRDLIEAALARCERAAPQLLPALVRIISQHFGCAADKVTAASSLVEDFEGDSLDALEIITSAETAFGIEISDDQAEGIVTVGCLDRIIRDQTRSEGAPS